MTSGRPRPLALQGFDRVQALAAKSGARSSTGCRPRPTASNLPARRGGGRAARGIRRPFFENHSGLSSARRPSWL